MSKVVTRPTEYVELEGGVRVIRYPDGAWVLIRNDQRQTMQPNASATKAEAEGWKCDDCGAPVVEADCSVCDGSGDDGAGDCYKRCGGCDGSGKRMVYSDRLEKAAGRMKGADYGSHFDSHQWIGLRADARGQHS